MYNIRNKLFDKSYNAYIISINFKMSLQNLIDNPKELLELINDFKKYGEIFTPIKFINNMLGDLEKHYKEKYNKNIILMVCMSVYFLHV